MRPMTTQFLGICTVKDTYSTMRYPTILGTTRLRGSLVVQGHQSAIQDNRRDTPERHPLLRRGLGGTTR